MWWCDSCMTYHSSDEPPCFNIVAVNAQAQSRQDGGLRFVKPATVEVSDPTSYDRHSTTAATCKHCGALWSACTCPGLQPHPLPFTPRDIPNLDEPDPVVIAYVEDILARAKTGELRAIAVACVYRARVMGSGWTSTEEVSRLKGEIAQLLHDFCVMHAAMRS